MTGAAAAAAAAENRQKSLLHLNLRLSQGHHPPTSHTQPQKTIMREGKRSTRHQFHWLRAEVLKCQECQQLNLRRLLRFTEEPPRKEKQQQASFGQAADRTVKPA
eukprot:366096-Pelagomonas_calceolata.AAC.4